MRKSKSTKVEQGIKLRKAKKEDCCADSKERFKQALDGYKELPDDCVITGAGREMFGMSFEQRKDDKETW